MNTMAQMGSNFGIKVKVVSRFQVKRKLRFRIEQNSVKFFEEEEGPYGIQGVSFEKDVDSKTYDKLIDVLF
jgi:hypothetical protein